VRARGVGAYRGLAMGGLSAGWGAAVAEFTDARLRGQGHGASLLRDLERRLAGLAVTAYWVRTVLSPSNRACAFYRANEFDPVGMSRRLGTNFQVLVKALHLPAPTGTDHRTRADPVERTG